MVHVDPGELAEAAQDESFPERCTADDDSPSPAPQPELEDYLLSLSETQVFV